MRIAELPVIRQVVESGADDRVFDGLVLAGPVVILVIVFARRTPLTIALALSYIGIFLAYVAYKGLR